MNCEHNQIFGENGFSHCSKCGRGMAFDEAHNHPPAIDLPKKLIEKQKPKGLDLFLKVK